MALYIVGTPIGNLGDVTKRAAETLAKVDLIACEDTKRTRVLLAALGVKKPLVSYYKHKEQEGAEYLLGKLREGAEIALVSDAGMPVISDPGAVLVRKARESGVKVETVPGPTAVTTAAALVGLDGGFVFVGFLPEKTVDKKKKLAPLRSVPLPLVFYVGPHDVEKVVAFLYEELGDRTAYLVKELTKIHEGFLTIRLADGVPEEPRGEYVVIVEGATEANPLLALTPEEHLAHYLASGMEKKEAIKKVASERGVSRDTIYKLSL